jgi:hypothetical protein
VKKKAICEEEGARRRVVREEEGNLWRRRQFVKKKAVCEEEGNL